MREELATPDVVIAQLASRQHGVVSVAQLAAAGIDKSAVTRRLRAGRLHRIHRGVYAVGHAGLGNEGRWTGAVLALGEAAALSHRSAAQLWDLLPASGGLIDVTTPGPGGRSKRPGLRIHRSSLPRSSTTRHKRIAVTTPARTLVDLKRVVPAHQHRRAIRQAEIFGLDLGHVAGDRTRSDLERRLLRICRRHHLPAPVVNTKIGPYRVDFLWPRRRLIVETDGSLLA